MQKPKSKKTTHKVIKAKKISPARRTKLIRSASKNKKALSVRGKKVGLIRRIWRKPVTKISTAAAVVGLGGLAAFWINYVPSLESVQASVVQVEACNANDYDCGSGSGFAAFKDNYIVTNYHVIDGADTITIKTIDGVEGVATKIVLFDPVNDIAILEWNHTLGQIWIGSSDGAKVGDRVLAIGNPLNETNVVSEGIISSKTSDKGIMTTAAISPGSSGGALILDSNHRVIGMTYLKRIDGESMNYAIRIEDIKSELDEYNKGKAFSVSQNNKSACHVTLAEIAKGASNLAFKGCKDSGTNIYSIDSVSTFYEITNDRNRFEYALSARSDWKAIYNRLGSSTKNMLVYYLDNTHSAVFPENWKYAIWRANEKYYYTCQTTWCMVERYRRGYYPTELPGNSEADFKEL